MTTTVFLREANQTIHDCMTIALDIIDTLKPQYSPKQWLEAKTKLVNFVILQLLLSPTKIMAAHLLLNHALLSDTHKEFSPTRFDTLLWEIHNIEVKRHLIPTFEIYACIYQEQTNWQTIRK